MLQPAGAMLFNRHSTAEEFREKFFSKFTVGKIINLSALRFGFFKAAVSPACIVVMRPVGPSEDPTVYICPKPRHTKEDDYCVVVEPSDRNLVYPEEATKDRLVWTVLAWGGRRDLALIRKLHAKPFSTIAQLEEQGLLRAGNGFKRKSPQPREYPESRNLPVLEDHEIWDRLPLVTDTRPFPPNTNLKFERFRDLEENFSLPLMIMKESWTVEAKRFKGVFPQLQASDLDTVGQQQETLVRAVFHSAGMTREVPKARLIEYSPAPHHPRPNTEYRFTFHDRSINPGLLEQGDILVFLPAKAEEYNFDIFHITPSSPLYEQVGEGNSTFGWL